ncbi:MAG: hypothetical protein ACYTGL_06275 [Planctomycetota bacterium]|jgi:hypothetical protein
MPRNNQFRHQAYPTEPTIEPVVLDLTPEVEETVDFSRLHSEFGVSHVELVHGTFTGSDPFGIHAWMRSAVSDASPAVQVALLPLIAKLEERTKKITDTVRADIANYDEKYRAQFEELAGNELVVSRLEPTWSSENTHLARAALAVRMLCRLVDLQDQGLDPEHERIMLWGHSHGGNGFAILTNLLANDRQSVEAFFAAAGDSLGEEGTRAQEILAATDGPHSLAKSLIIVTFGTPVRYGWDSNGCRQLLHVVHHRPVNEDHPTATVPAMRGNGDGDGNGLQEAGQLHQNILDALFARHGDWLQMFAIAGTDLRPTVNRDANQSLGEYLERNLPNVTPQPFGERLPIVRQRWQTATRMHADGLNLLVEFAPTKMTRFGSAHQTIFGHAVYTRREWLPRQLELVLEHLRAD